MKRIAVLLLASLLLAGCEFSLAGDVTPPPATEMVSSAAIEYPASLPNLAAGERIYLANCAPCHGVGGLGDGEQSGQLPFPPAALGDRVVAEVASPEDWFRVITDGNLGKFMPPFEEILTSQERWNVLAYSLSLSWEVGQLDRGAELYAEHKEVLNPIPSIVDSPSLAQFSREELLNIRGGLGEPLPELSSIDYEALAVYFQAAYLGISEAISSTSETSQPQGENAIFKGSVVDGTDGNLPADLEAVIFGYDHDQQAFTATVPIDSSGRITFYNVPLAADRIYFVSVDYAGLSYFSEFITFEEDGTEFVIPITVYETTTDTAQLAVEVMQLVFEFPEPGIVRIVERVEITNLGDRAVAPTTDGVPVLHFSLPAEASDLQFQDGALGDRYVAVEGGFGDLRAVLPGETSYQNLFAYDLPYSRSLTMQAPIDLPTRTVLALVPENEIVFTIPEFQLLGLQQIDSVSYSAYLADGGFSPGDDVEISLKGPHPLGSGGVQVIAADDRLLTGLAALTAAVGIAWLWLRRVTDSRPLSAEQIMDEIIALDESYENADIKQSIYEKRRAALKERLRSILVKSKR